MDLYLVQLKVTEGIDITLKMFLQTTFLTKAQLFFMANCLKLERMFKLKSH